MDKQQTSESGTELQGTEDFRVRPRRGEKVRRDLQNGQVLAREEQERIHCLEIKILSVRWMYFDERPFERFSRI